MKLIRVAPGYYLAKISVDGVERVIEVQRLPAKYTGYCWKLKLGTNLSEPFLTLRGVKEYVERKYPRE